jgi:putative ABC transport system permease protein
MSLFYLFIREIAFCKFQFFIGFFAVFIITFTLFSGMEFLYSYNKSENSALDKKVIQTDSSMRAFESSYQLIIRKMGFTYRLIPSEQMEADFFSNGYSNKVMPYSIVTKLIKRKPLSIESAIPVLRKKIWWKEQGRSVLVCGIGTDSINAVNLGEFIPIPPLHGKIAAGYCLGDDLKLKKSAKLTVNGNKFVVDSVHNQRGSTDDITLWLNLADAQKVLSKYDMISEIWLWMKDDQSEGSDKTGKELAAIAKEYRVIEMVPRSVVKAKSLLAARKETASALKRESELVASSQKHRNRLLALAGTTGTIVGVVLIFLLSWANLSSRYGEIGLLRSIGFTSRQIFVLFLGRTSAMCLCGSAMGCAGGCITGLFLTSGNLNLSVSVMTSLLIVTTAFICSLLSGLLPAVHAVNRDPVTILMKE